MDILTHERMVMQDAARHAGVAVMRYFQPGQQVRDTAQVREKSHDNPLTLADLEADQILRTRLLEAFPGSGWLSEETADNPKRLQHERVWVVDPIDGTKEFINGIPQFAISIGLVEAGVPIAATVFNPASNELFHTSKGQGAFLNDQPLHVTTTATLPGATCLASRSETKRGDWKPFEQEFRLTQIGSIAYKLALLAAGRFDLTFTLTPKSEWDICAGVLLIQEAGGVVTTKEGHPFRFNQPDPRLFSLVAANPQLHPLLLDRLRDIPLSPDRGWVG